MDRAEALLGGLRVKAALGPPRLEPAEVEALAGALGISAAELPALVGQLGSRQPAAVTLVWGGGLDVLPLSPSVDGGGATYTTFNLPGAQFGDAATFAGRDAQGGTVTKATDSAALGAIAQLAIELARIRSGLQGEAAALAAEAEAALRRPPAPEEPEPTRRRWVETTGDLLGRLVQAAPQLKALVDIGEKAAGALT